MTTVAVMQPYLFPYIGYYQLVAAVDIFIFLDDVSFIKGGYVNRNWLMDRTGQRVPFRIPVKKASQNKRINELTYLAAGPKPLKMLRHCYGRAPGFDETYRIFYEVTSNTEGQSLTKVNALSIELISEHLRLGTNFITASAIDPARLKQGQERILELCRQLKATHYLNLPGGRALYDSELFLRNNIELLFLHTKIAPFKDTEGLYWHPSFLHHLMTREYSSLKEMLARITLDRV